MLLILNSKGDLRFSSEVGASLAEYVLALSIMLIASIIMMNFFGQQQQIRANRAMGIENQISPYNNCATGVGTSNFQCY